MKQNLLKSWLLLMLLLVGVGTGWAQDVVKCTSESDLVAGGVYYISGASSYSSTATVMGLSTGGNNFPESTFGESPCELTLGGDATNGWTFSYKDGSTTYYLDPTNTTGSNYLKRNTSLTNYGKFTISFSNGAVVITSKGKSSRNIIRYNSSSKIYSCYSNGQASVYLYKKESSDPTPETPTVTAPTFDVAAGAYTEDQLVIIDNYSDDYMYAYTTDGSDPAFDAELEVTSGTLYDNDEGIEITSSCTLKAIAVDIDGNTSDITSATYVINKPVIYASLAALVASGTPTADGINVTVTLTDEVITRVASNGIFLNVNGQEIEIYCSGRPAEWIVGGAVSGTITCPWKLYGSSTWELCPENWDGISYTAPTTYAVNLSPATNGTISADVTNAVAGATVTLTATPATGYDFGEWTVTGATVASTTSATTTFTMPASDVTVSATFNEIQGGEEGGEPETGTITFGNNDVKINAASVTGDDNLGNTWTITTAGTTSFTANSAYYQVGSSTKPATSITFTTTLPDEVEITSMSAKFGGFSGTAGTVTLKVGTTTIGTGSLNAANDVTVNSTSTAKGKVITVTITGIAKGVKCYNISYTYTTEGGDTPATPVDASWSVDPVSVKAGSNTTATITTNYDGTLSVTSANEGFATATISGKVITVTGVAEGNTTLTVTGDATSNYNAINKTIDVTVTAATAPVVTLTTTDEIYNKAVEVGETQTSVNVTFNNWVVTTVFNSSAYVTDGTKGFIIQEPENGFEVGDVLSGTVAGDIKLFHDAADVLNVTATSDGLTVQKNGEIEETTPSISSLSGVNTGALVSFTELTYDAANDVFTDGENSIKLWNGNKISLPTFEDGKKYNLKGVYCQYDEVKEFIPRSAEDIELVEIPAGEEVYTLTPLADINPDDDVIVTFTNATATYAMSNDNGTSSAPTAVAVTVSNDQILTDKTNILWNLTYTDGSFVLTQKGGTNWLYCTATNNGVRVGTNTNKTFVITDGYIQHEGTSRYLGVYNDADVRCYTSSTTNIANQTYAFYVKRGEVRVVESISLSGTYTTEFNENGTFNHDGLVVTANYVGGGSKDVTAEATFSTPDMSAIGQQTVTVTYQEKTATYDINVTALPRYTIHITPTTDGTVYTVKAGEVVLSDGDQVIYGTPLTFECDETTVPDGFYYSRFYINNGGEKEVYMITNPCTFTTNLYSREFTEITVRCSVLEEKRYTVHFDAQTGFVKPKYLTENAHESGVVLPEATCVNPLWEFAGWTTEAVEETTTAPATLYAAGETFYPTESTWLYAVYKMGTGAGEIAFNRMTDISQLEEGKRIVIVSDYTNRVLTLTGSDTHTQANTSTISESDGKYIWTVGIENGNYTFTDGTSSKRAISFQSTPNPTGNVTSLSKWQTTGGYKKEWTVSAAGETNCWHITNTVEANEGGYAALYQTNPTGNWGALNLTNTSAVQSAFAMRIYVEGPAAGMTYDSNPDAEPATLTFSASSGFAHYATFSCEQPVMIPQSIKEDAFIVSVFAVKATDDGKIALTKFYDDPGYTYVPANTGVMIAYNPMNETGRTEYDATKKYNVTYYKLTSPISNLEEKYDEDANMLYPSSTPMSDFSDCKFYKLAYYDQGAITYLDKHLGFYYGAAGGGVFTSKAGLAYMAVPTSVAVKYQGFELEAGEGIETGIEDTIITEETNDAIYNLKGQRVMRAQKGIYIVNGKKVIFK